MTKYAIMAVNQKRGLSAKKPEYIRDFPWFSDLSAEQVHELGALLEIDEYPADAVLFQYGTIGPRMYFVCEGIVGFSVTDNTRHTEPFTPVSKGACFGEVALFSGLRRTADCKVIERAITLELSIDNRDKFLDICPQAASQILISMAQRLEESAKRSRRGRTRLTAAVQGRRLSKEQTNQRVVREFATLRFMLIQVGIIALWVIFFGAVTQWDPYPFGLLALFLAAEALFIALTILMYQTRQEDDDRVRDDAQDATDDHLSQRLDDIESLIRDQQQSLAAK